MRSGKGVWITMRQCREPHTLTESCPLSPPDPLLLSEGGVSTRIRRPTKWPAFSSGWPAFSSGWPVHPTKRAISFLQDKLRRGASDGQPLLGWLASGGAFRRSGQPLSRGRTLPSRSSPVLLHHVSDSPSIDVFPKSRCI